MKSLKSLAVAVVVLLTACAGALPPQANPVADAQQRLLNQAQATYEEKCRTLAGEKIYKTVPDIEGLLVMKVRPARGAKEWADLMWSGAAFAKEMTGDEYIKTFLWFEHSSSQTGLPVKPGYRGYINSNYLPDNPSNLPGYRWVEAIDPKDGQRYRYSGRWEEPWQYDKSYLKGYIKFFLDTTPATGPLPRYGVTYEDHVIPEDRALGIASSTVKVIDLKTNEVLGETTRYAWTRGGASTANPSPWLTAYKCPPTSSDLSTVTRQFVDQILVPMRGR